MRAVSTRVLPVPAPASTSSGPFGRLHRLPLLRVEPGEPGRAAARERARGNAAALRHMGAGRIGTTGRFGHRGIDSLYASRIGGLGGYGEGRAGSPISAPPVTSRMVPLT